jgi:hypothetical protein
VKKNATRDQLADASRLRKLLADEMAELLFETASRRRIVWQH